MSEDITVEGHCYCEAVAFTVRLPADDSPIFSSYCHCENCRRSHAAPLYQVIAIDAAQHEITRGAEHVVPFQKTPGKITRAFCGKCGTRLYNTFSESWRPDGKTPLAWFPMLLKDEYLRPLPEKLRPKAHFSEDKCVLDFELLEKIRDL